jgi:hypothetical protein
VTSNRPFKAYDGEDMCIFPMPTWTLNMRYTSGSDTIQGNTELHIALFGDNRPVHIIDGNMSIDMAVLLPNCKDEQRTLMMRIIETFYRDTIELEGMFSVFSSFWLSNRYISGIKLFTQAQRKLFKTPIRLRKYMHDGNVDIPGAILLVNILLDIEAINTTWRTDESILGKMNILEESFYIYCESVVGTNGIPYFIDSHRLNGTSIDTINIITLLFLKHRLYLASYSVSLVFDEPNHNGISPIDMYNLLSKRPIFVIKSRKLLSDSVNYPFEVTDDLTSTAFWIWYEYRKSLHVAIFASSSSLRFEKVPNNTFSLELASIIEGIPVAAHYMSEHISETKLFTITCLFLYTFDKTDLDIHTIDADTVRRYLEIDDYAFVYLVYHMLYKYNFNAVMEIIRNRKWNSKRHGYHCMEVVSSALRNSLGEDNYRTISQYIGTMPNLSRADGRIRHMCETELIYNITPNLKFSERVRSLISYIYPYLYM